MNEYYEKTYITPVMNIKQIPIFLRVGIWRFQTATIGSVKIHKSMVNPMT